jgi:aryl-alcohol dehydrogenase-like predicted oxidoreductase
MPGTKKLPYVVENIGAINIQLNKEELMEIDHLKLNRIVYTCEYYSP